MLDPYRNLTLVNASFSSFLVVQIFDLTTFRLHSRSHLRKGLGVLSLVKVIIRQSYPTLASAVTINVSTSIANVS
jgi:hypothetical protein